MDTQYIHTDREQGAVPRGLWELLGQSFTASGHHQVLSNPGFVWKETGTFCCFLSGGRAGTVSFYLLVLFVWASRTAQVQPQIAREWVTVPFHNLASQLCCSGSGKKQRVLWEELCLAQRPE